MSARDTAKGAAASSLMLMIILFSEGAFSCGKICVRRVSAGTPSVGQPGDAFGRHAGRRKKERLTRWGSRAARHTIGLRSGWLCWYSAIISESSSPWATQPQLHISWQRCWRRKLLWANEVLWQDICLWMSWNTPLHCSEPCSFSGRVKNYKYLRGTSKQLFLLCSLSWMQPFNIGFQLF